MGFLLSYQEDTYTHAAVVFCCCGAVQVTLFCVTPFCEPATLDDLWKRACFLEAHANKKSWIDKCCSPDEEDRIGIQ